jgi:hypothetical protein
MALAILLPVILPVAITVPLFAQDVSWTKQAPIPS